MQGQRTRPSRITSSRVARRYHTCAEALRAATELETLAEVEVSHLRDRGREAEADRRADAWNREIARALGEAEALRQDVAADMSQTRIAATGQRMFPGPLQRAARSPSRLLATAAVALVVAVALARVIEALAPELLIAALIAAALSFLSRPTRSSRRSRHGR
jgi:hypothetical protein